MKFIILFSLLSILAFSSSKIRKSARRIKLRKFNRKSSYKRRSKYSPKYSLFSENYPKVQIIESNYFKPAEYFPALERDMKYEEPCRLKEGFVFHQIHYDQQTNTLSALPTLAVLNAQAISFFESTSLNSLMTSYRLKDIFADPSENYWRRTLCIPIHNKITFQVLSVMCVLNPAEIDEWIDAINSFKGCNLEYIERRKNKLASKAQKKENK